MAPRRMSDDLLEETVKAFLANNENQTHTAHALGISRSTLQARLARAAAKGMLGTRAVLPGFQIKQTSEQLGPGGELQKQWVKQAPAGEELAVPEGHVVKGVSALTDAQGNVIQQWVKTQNDRTPLEWADLLRKSFEDWVPPPLPVITPVDVDADTLTLYGLADMHLGLKAVADESGSDFDLDIATRRFRETTARLFQRSPNSAVGLIVVLGDWTHVDDDLALTPTSKNTLQVSDRLLDIVRAGVQIMKDYIYHALTKHQRVKVKVLKGNHDLNVWITLYVALKEHFAGNERVEIDDGAADYWFFRFGSTLLGFHHGHRLKPEEMAGAMATECREDWGETLYRLFLHGHLHHQIVKEVLGVRVECLRTIADVDQHHSGKYGSGKSLVSITLHKEHGEDGRVQINLPPVRRRAATLSLEGVR
jgi:predicted phosphodiesterase